VESFEIACRELGLVAPPPGRLSARLRGGGAPGRGVGPWRLPVDPHSGAKVSEERPVEGNRGRLQGHGTPSPVVISSRPITPKTARNLGAPRKLLILKHLQKLLLRPALANARWEAQGYRAGHRNAFSGGCPRATIGSIENGKEPQVGP
jgi:hypothetical protein